ncbi:lipoprotein, putative [Pseudomonas chlororaphis subsp. aurantiaca]|nr:lipoprotein, putative [Pseudomonas chlororaphis subsp. aurantiaca]
MPWKLASFGTLLAAVVLTGCSTSSPDKDPVATESGHSRCEAKAAEFAIGKKPRLSCWSRHALAQVRRTPVFSSRMT